MKDSILGTTQEVTGSNIPGAASPDKVSDSLIDQISEVAPVLVWRNGGRDYSKSRPAHLRGFGICYPSKEDAMAGRSMLPAADTSPDAPEPYRIALADYRALNRHDGKATALIDADLNILEVYR